MSEATDNQLWSPPSLSVVTPHSAQQAYEASLDDGRRQGYEAGLQQGLAEGRRQAQSLLAEMSTIWEAMQAPFLDLEAEVQSQLLGLSVAVARAVVDRELKTDDAFIASTLDTALAALADVDAPLRITFNPIDRAMLESLLDEQHISAEWVANPNMLRGGCHLQRGSALVDATIEARIVKAIETLATEQNDQLADVADTAGEDQPLDPDRIAAIAARFADRPIDKINGQ